MLSRPVETTSISLRPATMDDAKNLLSWKNDPVMRQFSIVTHDEIKWEDHLKWLEKNLGKTYIITDGITDYGDMRIDDGEVAIKLDPQYRGQGIGYKALRIAAVRPLKAKIVDGNVASMHLFIKCGFNVVDHKDNYYILENW